MSSACPALSLDARLGHSVTLPSRYSGVLVGRGFPCAQVPYLRRDVTARLARAAGAGKTTLDDGSERSAQGAAEEDAEALYR